MATPEGPTDRLTEQFDNAAEAIEEHRELIETLAESDLPASPIAQDLLEFADEHREENR